MKRQQTIIFVILLGICGLAGFIWLFCNPTPKPPPKPIKQHVKVVREPKVRPVKQPHEAQAGTIAYLDARNGFRDATFGASSESIPDLVLLNEDAARHMKTFTRPSDDRSLGNVPLRKIEYTFFNDQLCEVTLRWRIQYPNNDFSVPPTTTLPAFCATLYGKPTKYSVNKSGDFYAWHGKKASITITETRLPGVEKNVKGGWVVPPITAGEMVIYNLPSARNVEAMVATQVSQQPDGL
jgi:hypothetical protein